MKKKKPEIENKKKEKEQPVTPTVVFGKNLAFSLSDILDMENKPEVKTALDAWIEKKEKAFARAEKRKKSRFYKRPKPRQK